MRKILQTFDFFSFSSTIHVQHISSTRKMRAATIPSPIEIPSRLFPRRTKLVRLISPQSPNSVFTAYRVIPRHYCGCLSSLTGKYEFSLRWNPTHTHTHHFCLVNYDYATSQWNTVTRPRRPNPFFLSPTSAKVLGTKSSSRPRRGEKFSRAEQRVDSSLSGY